MGGSLRPMPVTSRVGLACSGFQAGREVTVCHCVKPETPPFLAGVELFRERVVLTPFKMITVVERPGRDSTGSRRAAVEHATLMGTSQASDKSCQSWWCQPGPDHVPGCPAKTALPQKEAPR